MAEFKGVWVGANCCDWADGWWKSWGRLGLGGGMGRKSAAVARNLQKEMIGERGGHDANKCLHVSLLSSMVILYFRRRWRLVAAMMLCIITDKDADKFVQCWPQWPTGVQRMVYLLFNLKAELVL